MNLFSFEERKPKDLIGKADQLISGKGMRKEAQKGKKLEIKINKKRRF
jgi:hypothetical protein